MVVVLIIIYHQFTMTLQQQQSTIPCGYEYLNKTIGLSITDNHSYQFILIDNMIQVIRYDYQKLTEYNNKNDYKLNLNDGQMLSNGLEDLIPTDIVKKLLKIIQSTDNGDQSMINQNNNQSSIISMAMSIFVNGKIHLYLVKTLDQYNYTIVDYNQQIDMNNLDISYQLHSEKTSNIIGTISNQNNGIIILI